MPAWTYVRAWGRSPVATSVWEVFISWCGKTRSEPPPSTSKAMPRLCTEIAAHSTCQPGRPGPNGESQDGSPGRSACHSSASSGSFLPLAVRVAAALGEQRQHPRRGQAARRAELRVRGDREVQVAVEVVRRAARAQPL